LRVEFPRVNPLMLGLAFTLLYLVGLPLAAGLCICPIHAGCSSLLAATLAALAAVIVLHELFHYLAALALGVEGLRLKFNARLGAIMLDYTSMTPGQYVAVALAPQALTLLLILLSWASCGSIVATFACTAALVNLGGGIPDIVNAVYFGILHRRARSFHLLYDEQGRVVGGVVEYPDKLVVYLFHR
jgi:Zn-dependent protease